MFVSEFIEWAREIIEEPSPELTAYLNAWEEANNMPESTIEEVEARKVAMNKVSARWFTVPERELKILSKGYERWSRSRSS